MFHVKHDFLDAWRNYSKALRQRNAALRKGDTSFLDGIDPVLARYGEALSELRASYARSVSRRIDSVLAEVSTRAGDLKILYQSGWNTDSLLEALERDRQKDLERGVTASGPHRAELVINSGKRLARTVLSRGEQKAFSGTLILAQAQCLIEKDIRPIILFDDLVSEFDEEHFRRVLKTALKMEAQTWLTGTDRPGLEMDHKMFHVEQGSVRELV
jgi:DNA replication and repair protein RecF